MFSHLIFFALLLALWLLLSDQHTSFVMTLGVVSAAVAVWLGVRMQILGARLHTLGFYLRLPRYAAWLSWKVTVSCVQVAVTVLRPSLPINPGFSRVPMTQKDDLGKLVHANSITLTPGTISVRVEDDYIEMHALNCKNDSTGQAKLDLMVNRLEGGG